MKTLLALLLMFLPLSAVQITFETDSTAAADVPLITKVILRERMPDGTTKKVAESLPPAITELSADFADGKHTVFAVYVDAAGAEGLPSDDLVFHVLKKPGVPKIKVAFQRSNSLGEWETFAIMEAPEHGREFLRIAFIN